VEPPQLELDVDPAIERGLRAAEARGKDTAKSWMADHEHGTIGQFQRYLIAATGLPPDAATQREELAKLHEIAALRTEAGVKETQWIDQKSGTMWRGLIDDFGKSGAAQAKQGEATLKRANEVSLLVSGIVKKRTDRPRPYQFDSTLAPVPNMTHAIGSSFPSGHAAKAFAMATVFGELEPKRSDDYRKLAEQISFSRSYGAVHYPSDIQAGAFLGAAVGQFLNAQRNDGALPRS
jgi:hypothetical protein